MPRAEKGFWVVRPKPYARPSEKKGHVYAHPLLGFPIELWIKLIIPAIPSSVLMFMRTVCLAWKELADAELEKRHGLLGIPVWLGNQPHYPLADFYPKAMAIVTKRDLHIVRGWHDFVVGLKARLPIESLKFRRKSPKAGAEILGIPTNTHTVLLNLGLDRTPDAPHLITDNNHVNKDTYRHLLNLPFGDDTRLRPQTLVIWNTEGIGDVHYAEVNRLIIIGGDLDSADLHCENLVLYNCIMSWRILLNYIRRVKTLFIDNCAIIGSADEQWARLTPPNLEKVSIGRTFVEWSMNTTTLDGLIARHGMGIFDRDYLVTGCDVPYAFYLTFRALSCLHLGSVHDDHLEEALKMPWKIERPECVADFSVARALSKAPNTKIYGTLCDPTPSTHQRWTWSSCGGLGCPGHSPK